MRQLQVPVLYGFPCTLTVFSSDWLLLPLLGLFVLLPKILAHLLFFLLRETQLQLNSGIFFYHLSLLQHT